MSAFTPRVREPNFILAVVMTTAKVLFLAVLIIAVTGTGLLLGVAKAWIDTAPALDTSVFGAQAKTTFLYDKYGRLITDYKGSENRVDAEWGEIPENLKKAVIAVEDQRFYSHRGVDAKRIAGAFLSNLLNSGSQGGSTITQQLIKLTMLTSEQTYKRKLQEAYLALQLEEVLSKDEILLQYLNTIYMGGSLYGVKVAARDYFGKELGQLSLRECAMLARIIKNPYKYDPRKNFYDRARPETSEEGADYVLSLMLEQELITREEYDRAHADRLTVLETSPTSSNEMYENAYYVEYAIYDVVTKMLRLEKLEDTAANRSRMEQRLRTGGYSIMTSLDPAVQEAAQEVVTNWSRYPKTRYSSDATYRSSLGGGEYVDTVQPQAAVVVMDWHTGELAAIIGGRSTPTARKQLNRTYQMDMPVGSSIKPLSVYGPAFELGYSPGTPTINAPIAIPGWNTQKGYPDNYGGGGFTGMETLRSAINKSHNTATAWTLYMYVGIENSVNYLMQLGVSSKHISATGAGLALGSSGIPMVEMAAAYGAIANRGVYQEPYAFTAVYNSDGSLYMAVDGVQVRRRVFKESTSWMLIDVLEGCLASTGSAARISGHTVVGKTGTNSDARGVAFAGITGYYTCAVWIGHDNYKPLVSSATGGTYAAPLFSAVLKAVYQAAGITQDQPIKWCAAQDAGLVRASACGVSGMLPTDACKNDANGYAVSTDYYLAGTQPTAYCNMHRYVTMCTNTHMAAGPYCPSTVAGCIYVPQGHPLRNGSANTVKKYFWGASTARDVSGMTPCNQCAAPVFDLGADG